MYQNDRTTLAYWGANYNNEQDPTLDYANPAVQQWIVSHYLLKALAGGFQGISIDHAVGYNEAAAAGHYDLNGNWVQQYTGDYQDPAWTTSNVAALSNVRDLVKAQYPSATITNNQTYDCHWDPFLYKQSLPYTDIMFDEESFTDGAGNPPYVTARAGTFCGNKWLSKVKEYRYIQQTLGKGLVLDNREPYSVSQYMTDTNMQARFDLQWNLANYLLIKYNHTYFYWTGPGGYGTGPWAQHEYAAQVGSPTGDFYSSQNVYMRDYSSGLAVVNPSPDTSYTITLPAGTYVDLYGRALSSYTMPPHSGLVALTTGSPTPTSTAVAATATSTSGPTSTPVPTNTPAPTSTTVPVNTPTANPFAVPGTPTNVTARSWNSGATVSWTPPSSDGGSALRWYIVRAYRGTGSVTARTVYVSAPSTSTSVFNLSNGLYYSFTVQAVNAIGPGPESSRSNAVRPGR